MRGTLVGMAALALAACADGGMPPIFGGGEVPRAATPAERDATTAALPRYRVDRRLELPPPPGLEGRDTTADAGGEEPREAEPRRQPRSGPVRIGLLLPLTGPDGPVGRSLLDAAQLAVFELGIDAIEVLPRDTRGAPDGAAAAASEVIAAGADLIVGPLFADEADAAARVAQPRRVNVVAFSNDLAISRPGLYLMGHAPPGQVRRLLGFHAARGGRAVAVLAPADPYGRLALEATLADAGRLGLAVTAARYLPGDLQGSALARELQAFLAEARNADGLILPFPGARLLEVAPVLDYLDLDPARVRLMGTEVWEHPLLARERVLAGAVYAAPDPAGRDAFRARYARAFGEPPVRTATVAYDAVALAAMIAANAAATPIGRGALTEPNGFVGADGLFRLHPDGPAERGLAVLEVGPEGARVIDPAPADFLAPEFRLVGG